MKRRALAVFMLLSLAGCTLPPIAGNVLNLPTLPQQQDMWCWAASGQMTMRYLGHDVAQCTEANKRFGQTGCCAAVSALCDNGGWPEYTKYNFAASMTSSTALSFAQIKNEIDHNRPIAFSWAWTGGGGHMMVVVGYITIGNDQYVVTNNPEPYTNLNDLTGGTREIHTYADYVSSVSGGYTHWNDYYNIHYTGP